MKTAQEVLELARSIIDERSKARDEVGNRALERAVRAFNAITGHELSEEHGWLFMLLVKQARHHQGSYHPDDLVDAVGYVALQAEAASRKNKE